MALSLNIVPPDMAHDAMAASILEHGYIIIEGLAVDLTRQARDELKPDIEAVPFGHTEFLGAKTKRLGALLRRSETARELAVHPIVMAMCDNLLLLHCARYQLNFSGIMHLEPGAGAQALHRDGLVYPLLHPHPPTILPSIWALTDFTAENGGTQVAPGSHHWEHNRSDTVRTALSLQYSLGWLRQEENQYLANPPEVAKAYPERLQRLIGYDYGGPYLGFFNGDDPHRVLEDGHDGPAERTNPKLDAAANRVEWLRWGDMAPVPTPRREGQRIHALTKSSDVA